MSNCKCPSCCPTARFTGFSDREATVRSNLNTLDSLILNHTCCETKVVIQPSYDYSRYDLELLKLSLSSKKRSCSCYGSCHCLAKRRKHY